MKSIVNKKIASELKRSFIKNVQYLAKISYKQYLAFVSGSCSSQWKCRSRPQKVLSSSARSPYNFKIFHLLERNVFVKILHTSFLTVGVHCHKGSAHCQIFIV